MLTPEVGARTSLYCATEPSLSDPSHNGNLTLSQDTTLQTDLLRKIFQQLSRGLDQSVRQEREDGQAALGRQHGDDWARLLISDKCAHLMVVKLKL